MNVEQTIQQAIREARLGNTERARSLFREVAAKAPANARAWYLLSQVSDRQKALDCLNKVLEIEPGNSQALERIEKLKQTPVFEELEITQAAPVVQIDPLQKAANSAAAVGFTLWTWGSVLIMISVLVVTGLCIWFFLES
jgi:tetratricopeptide (TPR) repeat protein